MNTLPQIAPATRERLANPAPPGCRHQQIVKIAAALVAQGLNPEAIFCQIRPNYGPDVTDREIRSIVEWAMTRIGPDRPFPRYRPGRFPGNRPDPAGTETGDPISAIDRFLRGFRCEEVDLWENSPIRLEWAFPMDALWLLSVLFRPGENVNIVSDFSVSGPKGHPIGRGSTKKREEWIDSFEKNGPPMGEMGVWIRPNPTDGSGVSDRNTAVFRFLLVEFDSVPISVQLSFLARLALPISAVIASGGKSLHAWVRIDAETIADYRAVSDRIFARLAPFGVDTANRNPSRLSRLPGCRREDAGTGDGLQRLLYLNPVPEAREILP